MQKKTKVLKTWNEKKTRSSTPYLVHSKSDEWEKKKKKGKWNKFKSY